MASDRWAVSAVDPLGRRLRCKQSIWDEHILRKPEMYGLEAAVEAVLQSPEFINVDARHQDRLCYYGPAPWPRDCDPWRLKVVVRIRRTIPPLKASGEVVTAYLETLVPRKEQRCWPQP